MKLEITKEEVLKAASKCSTAKDTLQTLFPECFIGDPIEFEEDFNSLKSVLMIGKGLAPDDLKMKCLLVRSEYELRTQPLGEYTVLTFYHKL